MKLKIKPEHLLIDAEKLNLDILQKQQEIEIMQAEENKLVDFIEQSENLKINEDATISTLNPDDEVSKRFKEIVLEINEKFC